MTVRALRGDPRARDSERVALGPAEDLEHVEQGQHLQRGVRAEAGGVGELAYGGFAVDVLLDRPYLPPVESEAYWKMLWP